jgi:hypothetical protein
MSMQTGTGSTGSGSTGSGPNEPAPYGVVPARQSWAAWPPAPPQPADPVNWTSEAVVAVVGTLFLALSGAVAGLLWDAAAPKLSFQALAASADQTFRPQIGADAWFLLVTVLVGLVTAVALCLFVRRPGPGAAVALGAGGLLGAFVADRVGFLAERQAAVTGLHAIGFPATGDIVTQVDFRVHALGVVAGWPLVALAVLGIFVGIDAALRRA